MSDIRVERSVDMCYIGQFYEVTTPIPTKALASGLGYLRTLFDEAYERTYGRRLDSLPARCVTWRVLSTGPTPQVLLQATFDDAVTQVDANSSEFALKGQRRVIFPDHGIFECAVYTRERLRPGMTIPGPALVEEVASTIAIPPNAVAEVDRWRNVVIRWQAIKS